MDVAFPWSYWAWTGIGHDKYLRPYGENMPSSRPFESPVSLEWGSQSTRGKSRSLMIGSLLLKDRRSSESHYYTSNYSMIDYACDDPPAGQATDHKKNDAGFSLFPLPRISALFLSDTAQVPTTSVPQLNFLYQGATYACYGVTIVTYVASQ